MEATAITAGHARRRPQTRGEEIANTLTHGLGAVLGGLGLVFLLTLASRHGDAWRLVSLAVYGASLVTLYLASTLYHALSPPRLKRFFRLADHISIYLLIAGTYTPITLVSMRGAWGWTLFGIIWGLAVCGIVTKIFLLGKMKRWSVVFYVAMGWMALVALRPMLQMVPAGLLVWLGAGGLFYTLGVIFFAMKKLKFHHTIWHMFVLGGSACHFIGIALYIALPPS